MDLKSKSKPCDADRISGLPDAILGHILSFISTVDAVRTSVLSHRWKNVWLSVPIVDLDEDYYGYPRNLDQFESFVSRVLSLRHLSHDIYELRLNFYDVHEYHQIDEWISTAVGCKVVELNLDVGQYDSNRLEPLELPRGLFCCRSLVVLILCLRQNVAIPHSLDFFPSLKHLEVTVRRPDPATVESLFTCCPELEYLLIDGYLDEDQHLGFNIFSPKLKTLVLSFDHFIIDGASNFSFNVNAPKLEEFILEENFFARYSLSIESLNMASIYFPSRHSFEEPELVTDSADRIERIFAGIRNVKHLKLDAPILGDCYFMLNPIDLFTLSFLALKDPETEARCYLPTLKHLKNLELSMEDCCSWQLLARMLTISPNLENLVLEVNLPCNDKEEGKDWSAPKLVPKCLLSGLKTLSIRGFKGEADLEMAKYVLKHGLLMSNVTIYTCDVPPVDLVDVCRAISTSPKGSATCQIEYLNGY